MSLFSTRDFDEHTTVDDAATSDGPKCFECGLYKGSKNPKLEVSGHGRTKTLIISESSREAEDVQKKHHVGPTGDYFRGKVRRHGFNIDADFWTINSVGCRTVKEGKNKRRLEFNPEGMG